MKRKPAVIAAELEIVRSIIVELDDIEEPTDEEVQRSAAALEEYKALDAEFKKADAHQQQIDVIRSAAANPANREGGAGIVPGQSPHIKRNRDVYDRPDDLLRSRFDDGDVIERARYAIDQAPAYVKDDARERVMEMLRGGDELDENRQAPLIARHMLLTGSVPYHQAFREYMKTGHAGEILRATMALAPDSAGGFLVPFTLDPTIILTNSGIVDPIRRLATTKTIATDTWNGITSAGVTSSWTAEGGEMPDASPTFGSPSITPKRADTWVEGTYEMLADSGFASQLGPLLADAKQRHEGAAFATGNVGASRPRGVVAAVAAVAGCLVPSVAIGALARADVDAVVDSLRDRDAGEAVWLANKKIYSKIRQFDTTGGGSFWANMAGRMPAELLDLPRYEASSMTGVIAANANVLLCGNMSQFYIVDRVGMSVQFDPLLKGANGRANGKAGWAAFWRIGSDVVDPGAFRLLQLATAPTVTALG